VNRKIITVAPSQFDKIQRVVMEETAKGRLQPYQINGWALAIAGVGLTYDDELPMEITIVVDWTAKDPAEEHT
jgi:hypothetical protein